MSFQKLKYGILLHRTAISSSLSRRNFAASAVPGPRSYPIIGILPSLITDKDFDKTKIYRYFQKLFKVYGPIVQVRFPLQSPMILIQQPEDVRKAHHLTRNNPVRGGMLALKKAKYNNPYFEKKGGIVVEDGEEWWRVRSKVQAPVMKPKNLNCYLKDMDQVTLDFLERVSQERDVSGEVTLDFLDGLRKWALENMCLVTLNQRVGCFSKKTTNIKTQEIITAAQEYLDAITMCEIGSKMWKVYPTKAFQQMERSLKVLTDVCDAVLQEEETKLANRENKHSEEDLNLMGHLLLRGEEGLTRKDIVTFMLDIIPGGTSTTSDNIAVIMYQLAKNQNAQAQLQEELDEVLGDGAGHITTNQMAKLSYTRVVMKEANRVMPPMFGPVRILQEDIQLGEYNLKKGWTVLMLNGLLGWEESTFPQADKFLPERWMRDKPLGPIHPFTILPFSHGIRMCVGRRIAEQMMYIFLARVFHKYNVEWKHPDMVRDYKFVFSPRGPLKFTFTERR